MTEIVFMFFGVGKIYFYETQIYLQKWFGVWGLGLWLCLWLCLGLWLSQIYLFEVCMYTNGVEQTVLEVMKERF